MNNPEGDLLFRIADLIFILLAIVGMPWLIFLWVKLMVSVHRLDEKGKGK